MSRTFTLSVSATDSVDDVKAAIEAKNGMPCNLQRLVFAGKQLSGESLLADYKVTFSSCLELRPCYSAVSQQPKLFVKTLFGKTLVFDVDVTEETVHGLKARICRTERVSLNEQMLFFGGKTLNDGPTKLFAYGVPSNSTLHLVCRLPGMVRSRESDDESSDVLSQVKKKLYLAQQREDKARSSQKTLERELRVERRNHAVVREACKSATRLAENQATEIRKRKGDVDILRCMTAHELRELTESLSQSLLAAQREHSIKCSALASEVLCMACCAKRRRMVTQPCKHLSLCLECFERSGDRCPQCRASINGSIQVFV